MSRVFQIIAAIAVVSAIALIVISLYRQPPASTVEAAPDLETAAIARGLVRDASDTDPTGLYARDTDRLCVVKGSGSAYRVGVYIDYGDGISCSGAGTATRIGEALELTLGEGGCRFDAQFDGDRVIFPGRVPDACASLCTSRASLSGVEVTRLSVSASEASAMRDGRGKLPCASR